MTAGILLNLSMMLLGMIIIWVCTEHLMLHKLIAKLISTVLVLVINFLALNISTIALLVVAGTVSLCVFLAKNRKGGEGK